MRRRWRDWPWSAKLAVLLAVLAVAPLSVATLLQGVTARQELLASTREQNLRQARATAGAIDRYLKSVLADVRVFAGAPWTVRFLAAPDLAIRRDVEVALSHMRQEHGFETVFLTDLGGRVRLASDPRLLGRSYVASRAFLNAAAGNASFVMPRWEPQDEKVFLQVSAPVREPGGAIVGTIIGRVTMAQIDEIVRADTDFASSSELGVLWDADGIRLSHPARPELRFRPFEPLPRDTVSRLVAERRFGPRTAELLQPPLPTRGLVERSRWLLYDPQSDPHLAVEIGGQDMHVTIVPLAGTRWLYGILSPESAILAALREHVRRTLVLAAVIGLLAVALGLFAAGWATRPLRLVGQTANAIAAGDMSRRVGLDQRDEVGRLAAAFDAMADALAAKESELRSHAERLERRVEERTAELRASEAELRALFAAMRDAIFVLDDQGLCLKVAPTRAAMASRLVAELQGRRLSDVFPEERASHFLSQIRRALDTWQTIHLEYELVVNGAGIWLEAAITPLLERSVVWVARDITWRKRSEEERRELLLREQEARRKAEEANRIKDEFLSTVSHELRTPLNAILGWTWLLQSGNLDAAATLRAVDIIERNAKAQSQIVDDLLDVSRIITGKRRLKLIRGSLSQVLDAAVEAVRPAAEAKEIRMERSLDPDIPPISGDPNRLQQVAWNLLSNAVKFTPAQGRIEVRLDRAGSQARLQVTDSGIGIRSDFLDYVFDRFRQADSSTTRIHGGLGLGLAIVRHLVELHGGTVQAESEGEGRGAAFTVLLPFTPLGFQREPEPAPGRSEAQVAEEYPEIRNLRVLLVDDEADGREVARNLLERFGARVTVVASAEEALDQLHQREIDVLVADIGMPGTDGYELIRRVRGLAGYRHLPAVALTAYAAEADRKRALDAGFQDHVAKPVEPHLLAAAVATAAGLGITNA